ncbi:hypothetical protein VTK26DRAFT_1271 [Humicola hyalothermophila]
MQLLLTTLRGLAQLLLLVSIAANGAATATSYGNFSRSCTSVHLDDDDVVLRASCYPPAGQDGNNAGSVKDNKLELPLCIGLDQTTAQMEWSIYGKFSNYCRNCTLSAITAIKAGEQVDEHLFTCVCVSLSGGSGPVRSTINLDEGISNVMGRLECAGGIAALVYPEKEY